MVGTTVVTTVVTGVGVGLGAGFSRRYVRYPLLVAKSYHGVAYGFLLVGHPIQYMVEYVTPIGVVYKAMNGGSSKNTLSISLIILVLFATSVRGTCVNSSSKSDNLVLLYLPGFHGGAFPHGNSCHSKWVLLYLASTNAS